jgi:LmbE family N-acetylglucosaminyl deacetylase
MVAFDHRDAGTDPAAWTRRLLDLDLPILDLPGPGGTTGIVVVSPHPDDETLAVGGLLARAAALGIPVEVVLVTDGEASHPDSTIHTTERMAEIRSAEFQAALERLAPLARSQVLGVPDGGSGGHRETIEAAIERAVQGAGEAPLLVAPWRGDGHHDHRVAGEIAAAIAARSSIDLAEYPIWLWHWAEPEDPIPPWSSAMRVPLDAPSLEAKRAALSVYVSQTEPLSPLPGDEAIVDSRHLEHFLRDDEVLFVTRAAGSRRSRSRASFDEFYARRPGGWDFSSWYEERKRDLLLATLPRDRFRRTLEIGCATGVLTARLAERSDDVLGVDIADAPLVEARVNAPTARFERSTIPEDWPDGDFDLVVLSETGYYLSDSDLDRTVERAVESLGPDGVFVACHWRHPDSDAVLDAARVHERIAARWPGRRAVQHVEDDILLDVFVREGQPSIATVSGLA